MRSMYGVVCLGWVTLTLDLRVTAYFFFFKSSFIFSHLLCFLGYSDEIFFFLKTSFPSHLEKEKGAPTNLTRAYERSCIITGH